MTTTWTRTSSRKSTTRKTSTSSTTPNPPRSLLPATKTSTWYKARLLCLHKVGTPIWSSIIGSTRTSSTRFPCFTAISLSENPLTQITMSMISERFIFSNACAFVLVVFFSVILILVLGFCRCMLLLLILMFMPFPKCLLQCLKR